MSQTKLAIIVGSIRKESVSRRIAHAVAGLLPSSVVPTWIEIGDLPIYNPDLDTDAAPAQWNAFRDALKACDALLFVTPEHNRTMPAALKNALDVGSRPYGKNRWAGLPGAVISTASGALGGFGANHHLRQSLVFLDVRAMQQPEAYIGHTGTLLTDSGDFAKDDTKKFFETFIASFAAWIERNRK